MLGEGNRAPRSHMCSPLALWTAAAGFLSHERSKARADRLGRCEHQVSPCAASRHGRSAALSTFADASPSCRTRRHPRSSMSAGMARQAVDLATTSVRAEFTENVRPQRQCTSRLLLISAITAFLAPPHGPWMTFILITFAGDGRGDQGRHEGASSRRYVSRLQSPSASPRIQTSASPNQLLFASWSWFLRRWHCFVGRKFSCFVSYEEGKFIYFYLGQMGVVVFAS